MLEVYPNGKLFSFFPSAPRYLAVTACTTDDVTKLQALGYYGDIDQLTDGASHSLPYDTGSFQMVTMLHQPVGATGDKGKVPLQEFVRVLGEQGFGLLGGGEVEWTQEGIMESLMALEADGVDIMSIQKLDLAAPPLSDELDSQWEPSENHVEDNYFLALVRRV